MERPSDLKTLRSSIDEVDAALIELLDKRAKLVSEVADAKSKSSSPVSDPGREAKIVARALDWVDKHPDASIPRVSARRIFNVLMQESRAWQAGRSVAFLGPEGTYCHLAAMEAFGAAGSLRPERSIDAVFSAVGSGKVSFGVIPIENSIEGPVGQTLDLLAKQDVVMLAQVRLAIQHAALSRHPDMQLQDVKTVYSHPQALAQCRRWINSKVPNARVVPTPSTASEIETLLAATGPNDWIVIAGRHVAALYGLSVLEEGIVDNATNTTMFAALKMREAHIPNEGDEILFPEGEEVQRKTSLLLTLPHAAGSLYRALQPIGEAGVNMLRIQSRPVPEHPWEYMFFIDLEGMASDPILAGAIEQMELAAGSLKRLGSYPVLDLSPRRA